MSKQTRPIFYLIACLIPVVLLAFIELSLRLIGYGQTIPLFVESEAAAGYMQPNPNIIQRYFASPELAPNVSPDTVLFRQQKDPNTFRIVIQGGSSAAGFPYGRFGSLQGMLEQRFKRVYPEKDIEIINTAMAAVNTYTLLDFVDEIVAIDPDVVLIYTGHNEYLGVLGAGSAFAAKGGRAPTLAFLLLKEFRLYQLLQSLYVWWQTDGVATAASLQDEAGRSLMSKAAQGKNIPFGSDTYEAGLSQFEGNIEAILSKYQQKAIPVLIGNLVSNELDLPPFSTINKYDWPQLRQQITTLTESDQTAAGAELVKLAERFDDEAALAYFQGLVAAQTGDKQTALRLLQQAKDLDQLRFRAPTAFNSVITRLSKTYKAQLVDVENNFRQQSQHGLIDNQLMLEHVHPTLDGYFILAEAFFQQLLTTGLMQAEFGAPSNAAKLAKQAWSEVPVSELNKRWAELKIAKLIRDYPFTKSPQPLPYFKPETEIDYLLLERSQGADWLTQQQKLLAIYKKAQAWPKYAMVQGNLSDVMNYSDKAANLAATAYRRIGDIDMSIFYQTRSLRLAPTSSQYLMNQAQNYFMTQQFDKSIALLEQAKTQDADNAKVAFFLSKVKQMQAQQGR